MILDLKRQLKIGTAPAIHEDMLTTEEVFKKIKRNLPAIITKPKNKVYFSSKIQEAIEKLSTHKLVD